MNAEFTSVDIFPTAPSTSDTILVIAGRASLACRPISFTVAICAGVALFARFVAVVTP